MLRLWWEPALDAMHIAMVWMRSYSSFEMDHQTVILSEAKDLRRHFRSDCPCMVFNDHVGKNQEGVSREIDFPEVLRFAQDDRTGY
jgi:hypothetical protein